MKSGFENWTLLLKPLDYIILLQWFIYVSNQSYKQYEYFKKQLKSKIFLFNIASFKYYIFLLLYLIKSDLLSLFFWSFQYIFFVLYCCVIQIIIFYFNVIFFFFFNFLCISNFIHHYFIFLYFIVFYLNLVNLF